jgi:transcriptional regulator with XRE-family HTH domain
MRALSKTRVRQSPTPTLASFIKSRRYELGITQQEIAKTVGIASADYLSLVESGKRRLELDRIPLLASVLKVNPKELCQMALNESCPAMASVIFGTELVKAPDEDLTNKGEKESFHRLMMLDRTQRQPILDTIDVLFESRYRQRRGA